MLSVMIEQFNGGPVGLETMAASTGEDTQTIEEVYEPYLMQIGYTSDAGRIATPSAYKHWVSLFQTNSFLYCHEPILDFLTADGQFCMQLVSNLSACGKARYICVYLRLQFC